MVNGHTETSGFQTYSFQAEFERRQLLVEGENEWVWNQPIQTKYHSEHSEHPDFFAWMGLSSMLMNTKSDPIRLGNHKIRCWERKGCRPRQCVKVQMHNENRMEVQWKLVAFWPCGKRLRNVLRQLIQHQHTKTTALNLRRGWWTEVLIRCMTDYPKSTESSSNQRFSSIAINEWKNPAIYLNDIFSAELGRRRYLQALSRMTFPLPSHFPFLPHNVCA